MYTSTGDSVQKDEVWADGQPDNNVKIDGRIGGGVCPAVGILWLVKKKKTAGSTWTIITALEAMIV